MRHIHGGDIYAETGCRRGAGGEESVLDFSASINPLGMPPSVREAALAGVDRAVHYPDTGCRKLRRAIIEEEGSLYGLTPDQVICANGAAELIFLVAAAVRPKRTLLVAPGFAEYERAALACRSEVCRYECRESDGFAVRGDFIARITRETDLVFLCNPNNPTGALIPGKLLEAAVKRCHETGTVLVLDECFTGFTEKPEQISMLRFVRDIPELFILKAFTKMYAMPGLRLGYGYSSNTGLMEKMMEMGQPWNVSLPAQMAGEAAIKEKEFAEVSRAYVAEERAFLMEGLAAAGMTCFEGAANFIFFKGPADLKEICAESGILIRDCSNFDSLGPGCWRIAVRRREENIKLLEAIGRAGVRRT